MLLVVQRRARILAKHLTGSTLRQASKKPKSAMSTESSSSSPAPSSEMTPQELLQESFREKGVAGGWSEAWEKNITPWDAGDSSPILLRGIREGWLDGAKRALVPGCGSGYDVLHLSQAVSQVAVGLDLAPLAVERFEKLREEKGVPSDKAVVECADFFTYQPKEPFDFIFDYTFLCALRPEDRELWGDTMRRLLRSGGELLTIIYPIRPDMKGGPPYAMNYELVAGLLEPRGFKPFHDEDPPDSIKPRLGVERVVRWRLEKEPQ